MPELDEETKEASITFFVDPRNRVYVRRINFNGADNVNDEVFRREMRQLEGGYLSNTLVDRSELSLRQLPYVENVEHETTPVPGSPDLVDVDFEIEEGLPGQFGGSLGFSETYGVTLGGNFIHSNFMGTGRRVALELRGGEYQKVLRRQLHGPLSQHRRRLAHDFADLPGHHAVHVGDVGLLDDDDVRGHELGLSRRELLAPDARLRAIRMPSC